MQPRRPTPIHYRTFLLTLWAERINPSTGHSVWRFSLENPHTAQRIGFGTLEALTGYLQQQMEEEQNQEAQD